MNETRAGSGKQNAGYVEVEEALSVIFMSNTAARATGAVLRKPSARSRTRCGQPKYSLRGLSKLHQIKEQRAATLNFVSLQALHLETKKKKKAGHFNFQVLIFSWNFSNIINAYFRGDACSLD